MKLAPYAHRDALFSRGFSRGFYWGIGMVLAILVLGHLALRSLGA